MDNLNFLQKTAAKLKTLFKDPLANAVKELKEVNSMLTQIKKTADQLSKTDLSNLETPPHFMRRTNMANKHPAIFPIFGKCITPVTKMRKPWPN